MNNGDIIVDDDDAIVIQVILNNNPDLVEQHCVNNSTQLALMET